MTPVRRTIAALLATLALVAVAGCSDVEGTDGKTWITGKGSIVQIDPADRGEPVEAEGESLDGEQLSLADHRGKVVVINVWASWCPPCREEMPTVVGLAESADPQDVVVLGVNTRQTGSGGESAARAYAEDAGLGFPSFYDPSSLIPMAISDKLGPYSLPSTAVLDRQGRVAALVLGSIPGRSTFRTVVDEVVAETADAGADPGAGDG